MQHQDQVLGLAHGDVLVTTYSGEFAFRFRCGPAPRYGPLHNYSNSKGHQGKVRKAWGRVRYRRTSQAIRLAEAHAQDGFKIRRGLRALRDVCPKWADDLPPRHATKNWKAYRAAQWAPRRTFKHGRSTGQACRLDLLNRRDHPPGASEEHALGLPPLSNYEIRRSN